MPLKRHASRLSCCATTLTSEGSLPCVFAPIKTLKRFRTSLTPGAGPTSFTLLARLPDSGNAFLRLTVPDPSSCHLHDHLILTPTWKKRLASARPSSRPAPRRAQHLALIHLCVSSILIISLPIVAPHPSSPAPFPPPSTRNLPLADAAQVFFRGPAAACVCIYSSESRLENET
ncbi:hypothetical protein K438DRAFT_2031287 [Mycena galopus ATCC 62051]|nr:hypothetical protein K438DRAFT_2031287 [Mycena galopus ATCC 62051]